MKIKKLLYLIPFLVFTETYADYGIIQDPDGYVNVRAQASLKAKVVDKLKNGEVVSCSFEKGEQGDSSFCDALYNVNGRVNFDFIHRSRVNFFNGFQKWKFIKTISNKAIYQSGKNQIRIVVQPAEVAIQDFKKTAQAYTHYKNKPFFGTDGGLPSEDGMYQLREIKITYKGKTIIIPQQNLEQYFFPNTPLAKDNFHDHELSEIYSKGNDIYILNSLSNGGAAQYTLLLHLKDGKLIKQSAWSESR
ncbi:SH3 domain-containing protein [Acinetobacter shaoyimingii]|uniref:SH3 domain-containing protein n=1 Tax=Acinetobacter shaoyimingii TaxID=2715164 RepID=A0A6G8RZL2_9GAMM|nr:SH3 domain-containing protein [Acinetobacter shaoyimingii]QIO07238.1 SH3 domain-containing protein [Acinetobacter shaoyimingii]